MHVPRTTMSAQARLRVKAALPYGTRRGALARTGAKGVRVAYRGARAATATSIRLRMPPGAAPEYADWLDRHRISVSELLEQAGSAHRVAGDVDVVFYVLPAPTRSGGRQLDRTLASLRMQTNPHWSARVLAPGALGAAVMDQRFTRLGDGGGVGAVGALRDAASLTRRSVMVALTPGDIAEPDLVYSIVSTFRDVPSAQLVYWHDDLMDDNGQVHTPRIRPGWSPETMIGANMLGRSFAVRTDALPDIAGLRSRTDDALLWECLLALDHSKHEPLRIDRILSHVVSRPSPAPSDAESLVQAHLDAHGMHGRTRAFLSPGGLGVRLDWDLPSWPSVSIVVPTRHSVHLLERLFSSLSMTTYDEFEVVVIDNGERTDAGERWYDEWSRSLPIKVHWWTDPFNYSAVNNKGAQLASGDVLVFLNDDTEVTDPLWLRELVGWAVQPGIGTVGAQLHDEDGRIQHGGVVIGMSGFADHLFQGMSPNSDSIFGPTTWYRNSTAATGACVATRRRVFEEVGGFDTRFELMGSDVVLGLDMRHLGKRTVVTPHAGVRHLEATTRSGTIPPDDFYTSYWRYQKWLNGGDLYYSRLLSLWLREPHLRQDDEPSPLVAVGKSVGRYLLPGVPASNEFLNGLMASQFRADSSTRRAVADARRHMVSQGPTDVESVLWVLPDFGSPYLGGINTALRIAALLTRQHGVRNTFCVLAEDNDRWFRSAVSAAFPILADSTIICLEPGLDQWRRLPDADVAIATEWRTAYAVAHHPGRRRKFYLIQDFEPMFFPGGTRYALAEQTYRFGLFGIANTERLLRIYEQEYGGTGTYFTPAVDPTVFHARDRRTKGPGEPLRVFAYSRPGHDRNCWELTSLALRQVKERFGDGVHIVTAGSWAKPQDLGSGIEHLGFLDYRDTGSLYRTCDIGLAVQASAHPSYLPLELMACGAAVVAFDSPATRWLLEHEKSGMLVDMTADGVFEGIERLLVDQSLRQTVQGGGLSRIESQHKHWDANLAHVYDTLCGRLIQ